MKIAGRVLWVKKVHFESLMRSYSGDLWILITQEEQYGFFLSLRQVRYLAKAVGATKVSQVSAWLEGRLLVITYDCFRIAHDISLAADYKGKEVPKYGRKIKVWGAERFHEDRARAFAKTKTGLAKLCHGIRGDVTFDSNA